MFHFQSTPKLAGSSSQQSIHSFVKLPKLRKRIHISVTASSPSKAYSQTNTPIEKLTKEFPPIKKSDSQSIPKRENELENTAFIDELIKRYSANGNNDFADLNNKVQRLKQINVF